jgi:phosphomevalonate kinase
MTGRDGVEIMAGLNGEIRGMAWGKVMLFGEYAVLDGGPAILAATPQIAEASYKPFEQSHKLNLNYPEFKELLSQARQCKVTPLYLLQSYHWGMAVLGTTPNGDLIGVGASFPFVEEALKQVGAPAGFYSIDTTGFGLERAGKWQKMGIGSSGASTAALCDLFRLLPCEAQLDLGTSKQRFIFARNLHRKVQGGLGSGADVASSTFGGIICFKAHPNGLDHDPEIRAISDSLPRSWGLWRGGSQSTVKSLNKVKLWQETHPHDYKVHMDQISAVAQRALRCITAHQTDQQLWCHIVHEGAQTMRSLSNALGLSLWTERHEYWSTLLGRYGGVIKPTGAGGDDLTLFAAESIESEQACLAILKEDSERRGELLHHFLLSSDVKK